MKCKQRHDLIEDNIFIPAIIGSTETTVQIQEWTYCEQPDYVEDDFYNTKVILNGQTVWVSSIDLDFEENK